MCSPSLVMAGLGAAASGLGSVMQMQSANAAAEAQARVHERQAKLERASASFEAKRFGRRYQRTLGQQLAALGDRGIDPSFAAPLIESDAEEADLDLGAIRFGGLVKSSNELGKADVARAGKSSGLAMGLAFLTPVIKAGAKFTSVGNPFATASA